MARPPVIRDEDILAAARHVFLEHGTAATTAAVAERAGISEGAIFKRFRSKHELFVHAMQAGHSTWVDELLETVGTGDVRETLYACGLRGVAFFRTVIPLQNMAWSNPDARAAFEGVRGNGAHPAIRSMRTMRSYFEAEKKLGRIGAHADPDVLTRLFGGSLYNFAAMEVMFGAEKHVPMRAEDYVRGLVDTLWDGIAPAARPAKKKKQPPRRRK